MPACKGKNPDFQWTSALLAEKRIIKSTENSKTELLQLMIHSWFVEIGDYNLEIIMIYFVKAMARCKQAERGIRELAHQLHPDIE